MTCPWNVGNSSNTIKYGKGQGMGTKCSFAIAQLTNNLFIKFCYNKYYPELSNPTNVNVGDDMALQDPEDMMSSAFERIGVPINKHKTKSKTRLGSFVEFVSRNS